MLTIDLNFEPLHELPARDLFNAVGVYTLWTAAATHRPTYLGEGTILDRLSSHTKRWRIHNAAVAIISANGVDKRTAKPAGVVAEAFLLELGELLRRQPVQNGSPGHRTRLHQIVEANNVLRVNIRGLHPFVHPSESRARLSERAECSVRVARDGDFEFTSPWNARRRPS
jgi:hypothetical protein